MKSSVLFERREERCLQHGSSPMPHVALAGSCSYLAWGHIAFPAFSLYRDTKWGIEGFYEALAKAGRSVWHSHDTDPAHVRNSHAARWVNCSDMCFLAGSSFLCVSKLTNQAVVLSNSLVFFSLSRSPVTLWSRVSSSASRSGDQPSSNADRLSCKAVIKLVSVSCPVEVS
jgi:hypothetical protein